MFTRVRDNKNINNNPTNDCNSALYGKEVRNRTTNKELNDWVWNEDMQKCMNPKTSETSQPATCDSLRGPQFRK